MENCTQLRSKVKEMRNKEIEINLLKLRIIYWEIQLEDLPLWLRTRDIKVFRLLRCEGVTPGIWLIVFDVGGIAVLLFPCSVSRIRYLNFRYVLIVRHGRLLTVLAEILQPCSLRIYHHDEILVLASEDPFLLLEEEVDIWLAQKVDFSDEHRFFFTI